jgi:hypothetical protein
VKGEWSHLDAGLSDMFPGDCEPRVPPLADRVDSSLLLLLGLLFCLLAPLPACACLAMHAFRGLFFLLFLTGEELYSIAFGLHRTNQNQNRTRAIRFEPTQSL